MTDSTLHAGLLLGTALGMRHALEPDHLAAVSTLVTRQRGATAGLFVGAIWGLGHTLSLLGVGLVLGAFHTELPARLEATFELCVAVMLVVLGARALLRARTLGHTGPETEHTHGGAVHTHAMRSGHWHVGRLALGKQPLLIGLVHGLAGSGALSALALAHMPTAIGRIVFMALFGIGSILGMAMLSGVAGVSLAHVSQRAGFTRALTAGTGALSIVVGLVWALPIMHELLGV